MSTVYRLSFSLAVFALFLASCSVLFLAQYPQVVAYLCFLMPILWSLWIASLFWGAARPQTFNLVALWVLIDLAVLLLYVFFSRDTANWSKSNGIDSLVFLTYFPIALPTFALYSLVPQDARSAMTQFGEVFTKALGGGAWDAVVVWLEMSIFAAVSSVFLFLLAREAKRKRRLSSNSKP